MKSPTVRVMAAADEDQAVETVVLAFAADPMARWTWPHAHQYLAAMPRMVRAFGGKAFSNGSAFCTDGYAGTALWLPPGVHPDEEALSAVLESTVAPSLCRRNRGHIRADGDVPPDRTALVLAPDRRRPGASRRRSRRRLDGVRTRAVRSRSRAGLFGILEPAQHPVLPAPRLRTARRDPGRFVADARPDAAATALSSECGNREENGAPEEIRTPDPQIRSLILSNSLTFLDFP